MTPYDMDPASSLVLIFPSKVDRWIVLLAAVPLSVSVVAVGAALMSGPPPGAAVLMVGLEAFLLGFLFLALKSTRYEVTAREVIVHSGLFRWRIAIDGIESIHPSRSGVSSPALSLDRLEIRYDGGRVLLVSPRDREGFLRAIVERSRHLHRAGEQVRCV